METDLNPSTKPKPMSMTLAQLEAMDPCDFESRKKLFGVKKSMNVKQALAAGASIRDILWVAGQLGKQDLCVKFALACAKRVSHLNADIRVQQALDVTQAWLDDPSEENRLAANAARAAYAAAAYAANAADAADAADATYAAARAAYAAANAAAYAAYANEEKAQKKILIEVFSI